VFKKYQASQMPSSKELHLTRDRTLYLAYANCLRGSRTSIVEWLRSFVLRIHILCSFFGKRRGM